MKPAECDELKDVFAECWNEAIKAALTEVDKDMGTSSKTVG